MQFFTKIPQKLICNIALKFFIMAKKLIHSLKKIINIFGSSLIH